MDNPLSSILRPGPAAPNNEQSSRETPVEGGDAAARRAIEQDTYPSARQVDWTAPPTQTPETRIQETLARQAQAGQQTPQAAYQPRQFVNETPQATRPVQDNRTAGQPAVSADDFLAGLEQAAMKDIGAELDGQTAADPAGEGPKLTTEERRARYKARIAEREANEKASGMSPQELRHEKQDRMLRRREAKAKKLGTALQTAVPETALEAKANKPLRKRGKEARAKTAAPRERGIPWTAISFVAMVLIPAAIASFYYLMIASPQYQVESQFSVRSAGSSSIATMGLPSLLGGSSSSTGDSYIVTSYVDSLQLVRDVQEQLGIDLRQFYTRDNIDWLYRISPDMPLEKFTEYWRDMTDVSFNSTTGNTTLFVYAFTAEDSKAIADAVLKVSERLVNELSESNRKQVMQVASKQVDRAEERLRKVQGEIRKLRQTEQTFDPQVIIQSEANLTNAMESQLSTLKTRLSALLRSVAADAPQAKALQKQIDAIEAEIAQRKSQLGNADADAKNLSPQEKVNLADVLNKFEELTIEQTFATQAYTTALGAFETAIVEAQRQERYFATFVNPTRPEIALYPLRYLDSFIAFLVLLAIWMVVQFLYRSFRDHAI